MRNVHRLVLTMSCVISNWKLSYPSNTIVFLVGTVSAVIALIGNTMVIYVVLRTKKHRTTANILIAGLASTDWANALLLQIPSVAITSFGKPLSSCLLNNARGGLAATMFLSTLSMLALVTHNRHRVFMKGPSNAQWQQTESKTHYYILLFVAWIISILACLLALAKFGVAARLVALIHASGCSVYIVCRYISLTQRLRKRERELLRSEQRGISHDLLSNFLFMQKRALRTISILLITLMVSFLPGIVTIIYYFYQSSQGKVEWGLQHQVLTVGIISFGMSSTLNPIIYASRQEDIGKEMKNIVCFGCRRGRIRQRRRRVGVSSTERDIVTSAIGS